MRTIVVETTPFSRSTNRVLIVARITRTIDYVFALLYTLLLVRLLLEFLSARRGTGFYEAVCSVTAPFYAPFKYIVASSSIDGAPVVWPLVIAIVAYALLQAGIHGLLSLVARG
jgi:uncharacterized protein YggT (Ycf19 family)